MTSGIESKGGYTTTSKHENKNDCNIPDPHQRTFRRNRINAENDTEVRFLFHTFHRYKMVLGIDVTNRIRARDVYDVVVGLSFSWTLKTLFSGITHHQLSMNIICIVFFPVRRRTLGMLWSTPLYPSLSLSKDGW